MSCLFTNMPKGIPLVKLIYKFYDTDIVGMLTAVISYERSVKPR